MVVRVVLPVMLLVLAALVAVAVWLAWFRTDVSTRVGDALGRDASCSHVGVMVFAGEREDVYECVLGPAPGLGEGQPVEEISVVITGGEVYDVTAQLQAAQDAGAILDDLTAP